MFYRKLKIGIATVVALTAGVARAGTMNASSAGQFTAPSQWQRGITPNSAYALWDNSFTSLTSNAVLYDGSNLATANVMAEYPAPLSGWNVADANPGAVTTTQHLYGSGQANLALSLRIPNYGLGAGFMTDFRIQSSTATLALDPISFAISADGGPAVPISPTVSSLGGSGFNNLYEFSVPGNASSYLLTFNSPAAGTNFKNVAINALSVDTFAAVPEPSTIVLGAAGVAVLSLIMLRRRQETLT